MKKDRNEIIIGVATLIVFSLASWFISLGIVRVCAKAFTEPNPHKWEWVYISTSPKAYSYHQKSDCKYLRKTTHNIEFISVDEADEDGRTPCSYCLEESRRHQYDNSALYVTPFVFMLLLGLIALIERVFRRYSIKSPFVKKKERKVLNQNDIINLELLIKYANINKENCEAQKEALSSMRKTLDLIEAEFLQNTLIDEEFIDRIGRVVTILVNGGFSHSIDNIMTLWNTARISKEQERMRMNTKMLIHVLWCGYIERLLLIQRK